MTRRRPRTERDRSRAGRAALAAAALALAVVVVPAGRIGAAEPIASTTVATSLGFQELVDQVKAAIEANEMGLVTQACASCGAARRGVTIPGNMVLGVYRNDFAVRMLEASVPAGIEAPIRFYVTENADGSASLTYRLPSAVFAPYGSAELDAMAAELDPIWQRIVADATG
jgi:uncharacterized protein (DUF302 family)